VTAAASAIIVIAHLSVRRVQRFSGSLSGSLFLASSQPAFSLASGQRE
jgi:hypothetical protein